MLQSVLSVSSCRRNMRDEGMTARRDASIGQSLQRVSNNPQWYFNLCSNLPNSTPSLVVKQPSGLLLQ